MDSNEKLNSEIMTIGEIADRLKKEYFPNPTNGKEILCRERELGIKKYVGICSDIIFQHIDYRINYITCSKNKPSGCC